MNFVEKYLKYKNKYLNLKMSQLGGSQLSENSFDIIIYGFDGNPIDYEQPYNVKSNTTIGQLKQQIRDRWTLAKNININFYFDNGIKEEDAKFLSDYGIQNASSNIKIRCLFTPKKD